MALSKICDEALFQNSQGLLVVHYTLRKTCPYSELFRSVFSRIQTEYGEFRIISVHQIKRWSVFASIAEWKVSVFGVVRMRENTDRNNTEYRHFSRSDTCKHNSSFYLIGVMTKLYLFLWGS